MQWISEMNRTKLLMVLLASLLLFLMLGGFGSRADSNRYESRKGRMGPSGTQLVYPFANPTPSKRNDTEAKKIDNRQARQDEQGEEDGNDPDLPPGVRGSIDKETYLRMRDEFVALKRGIEPGRPFDSQARGRAIERMEGQESELSGKNSFFGSIASFFGLDLNAGATWTPIGPAPLPNGQIEAGPSAPVTGRATTIAVDPTNSNKVYLGTAQGGVWRSLDGGSTWTNIFDSAQSLAIGAVTVDPLNPSTVFVGTGEGNSSGDSFFGVGIYRIDGADGNPVLNGPFETRVMGSGTSPSNGH